MRLAQRKLGWIGVDVGTSSLKVAQVARTKQGWQLAASAIIPRQQSLTSVQAENTAPLSSQDELRAAMSLQDGYQGRKVAAALPMTLCDIHRLDKDLSRESNPHGIIRQLIEVDTQQSSNGLQYDFWSAPGFESKPAWSQVMTAPRDWTEQLCEDIAKVGWSCEAIDGNPLTIARAVNMVSKPEPDQAVVGLEWGNSSATLCILERGQPSYVRTLKLVGLDEVLTCLTESLSISGIEAQRLLEEHGICGAEPGSSTDISALVRELVSRHLAALIEELERSFSHFQYARRMPRPKQLYLLGGGAMIRNLDKELSTRLKLDAQNWQLPTATGEKNSEASRIESLLASAIALSALAWEQS